MESGPRPAHTSRQLRLYRKVVDCVHVNAQGDAIVGRRLGFQCRKTGRAPLSEILAGARKRPGAVEQCIIDARCLRRARRIGVVLRRKNHPIFHGARSLALVADKSLQRVIQHPNVGVVRAVKARLARDEIDMVHGRVQQAAGALVFKNRPGASPGGWLRPRSTGCEAR